MAMGKLGGIACCCGTCDHQYSDDFNRADSETVGGIWTESVAKIASNKLEFNSLGRCELTDFVGTDYDHRFTAQVTINSTSTSTLAGFMLGNSNPAGGSHSGVVLDFTAGEVLFYTTNTLSVGIPVAWTLNTSTDYVLKIEYDNGNDKQLRAYVDGVCVAHVARLTVAAGGDFCIAGRPNQTFDDFSITIDRDDVGAACSPDLPPCPWPHSAGSIATMPDQVKVSLVGTDGTCGDCELMNGDYWLDDDVTCGAVTAGCGGFTCHRWAWTNSSAAGCEVKHLCLCAGEGVVELSVELANMSAKLFTWTLATLACSGNLTASGTTGGVGTTCTIAVTVHHP